MEAAPKSAPIAAKRNPVNCASALAQTSETRPMHNEQALDSEKTNKLSNKKRAKARKDRQGLQALLRQHGQPSKQPSLSLSDLMKK
jgi:hypothetical protein